MEKSRTQFKYTFNPPKGIEKLEHFEIDVERCLYAHLLGDSFSDFQLTVNDQKEKGSLCFSVANRDINRVPTRFEVTSCELDHSKGGIPSIVRVCETLFESSK